MYESRFGLRRRPFPLAPDSRYYFPTTGHERALAQLHGALANDEGLAVLTGPPGTGKTLLCHCLLERLGARYVTAFVTNSHLPDRRSLFQALLFDLGQPYEGLAEQELRLRVTAYLLKEYAAGRRTVLVIDEAQHFGADLLEELRLLGNLEAGEGKAVQVILAGLPALAETLSRPELAALNQRVAVRASVAALASDVAADYLLHHIRAAGGRPERILSREATALLVGHTGGVPRLLNLAAHQALLAADGADTGLVDVEVALEALAGLGLVDLEAEAVPVGEPGEAADALALAAASLGSAPPAAGEIGIPSGCRLYEVPGTSA